MTKRAIKIWDREKKNITRPCPRCGETNFAIGYIASPHFIFNKYHIECRNCWACGPTVIGVKNAVKAWNRG